MFQTFDHQIAATKAKKSNKMKLGLDPFAQINENEDEEEKSDEDEGVGKDSCSIHSS